MIRSLLVMFLSALLAACTTVPTRQQSVLIFSHTTGYRHDSIAPAIPALTRIVEQQGAIAVASEDPAAFDKLERYSAIILLSSTTDPKRPDSEWLVGPRRAELQRFVRRGGGVVAIHAAADSHYAWPWYGQMVGGQFERHPDGTPKGRLSCTGKHPITAGLPPHFERVDEWYVVRGYDPALKPLITLDPASIGESGPPRPMAWARTFEGGRVFTTLLGHTSASYSEPLFLGHVDNGLRWVLKR